MSPATFRPITPETEITVPCVLARKTTGLRFDAVGVGYEDTIDLVRHEWTHWIPIQWPEVG